MKNAGSTASTESLLGFAILGMLHARPQSGYDLRKAFVATPMRLFSDSPGAIYPALRRLRVRGWIQPTAAGHSSRKREAFEPTRTGTRSFRAWLQEPVTREQVVWGMEGTMLRFGFMGLILPAMRTAAFLESLAREIEAYVVELKRYHAAAASGMPLTGRLALGSGIDSYRTQARWARQAAGQFKKEAKRR